MRSFDYNVSEPNAIKNVAKGVAEEIKIADGFTVLLFSNDSDIPLAFNHEAAHSAIQFHFNVKGQGIFSYNNGNYKLPLTADKSLLLYNPQHELPIDLSLASNTVIISMLISIKKLHGLFSQEAEYIPFLNEEYKDKKYYKSEDVTPSMAIVLNQLANYSMNESIKDLYFTGKAYELLSLFFNRNEKAGVEQCPFLANESDVLKLRKAKNILIENMAEPPSLPDLANEVGLSLKKLKEGFKQVYGDSAYSFLFDYKMEFARKLLETNQYNVNEVGLKIGYSTASHFIAAFRKKYGTTPKKYIQSL
jgi:AraC-like DNA-binding protein